MPAKGLLAFACCHLLIGFADAAVPLPPETRLVTAANAAQPTQLSFNIAAAQDLVVTLTDLQFPGAVVSASAVVAQGAAIVASAQLAAPATSATASLPAAVGDYTLYVFGVPNAGFSVGTFSVCIAPKASPSNCIQSASLSGNITAPSSANDPTISTLNSNVVVSSAGAYKFTFQDFNFPAPLSVAPNVALFQGSTPIQTGIASGTSLNLGPGTYTLLAIAKADQASQSGVYGITVSAPGVSAPLDVAVAVGVPASPTAFTNPVSQSVTLKVTDYGFPGPLASAGALLTAGGSAVGAANAAGGATSFPAPAGPLKLWTYAVVASTPGTYSADVSAGATDLFTAAQGVQPAGSAYAYAFVSPVLTAGQYQATASDLQFPSTLTGLAFAVAQNGAIVQQSASAASLNFNAVAGNAIMLVAAQTPASGSASGNGLFDVNIQTTDTSPQLVFDRTQGVSSTAAFFDSQTVNLGLSASFDASLADLATPAQFENLALVISHGSQVLGKIFGGGTFSFPVSPGAYQLTFIATPSAQQQFGLYGVSILYTPPGVTLTSDVSSAAQNALVNLTWSSTNATSCTASGGNWTGSKATSGTEAVILSDTTTYTLSCSGPGGVTPQSISVTATPKPGGSGGGGGSIDAWLIGLAGLLALARGVRKGFRPADIYSTATTSGQSGEIAGP
jgi:hypothetical protein